MIIFFCHSTQVSAGLMGLIAFSSPLISLLCWYFLATHGTDLSSKPPTHPNAPGATTSFYHVETNASKYEQIKPTLLNWTFRVVCMILFKDLHDIPAIDQHCPFLSQRVNTLSWMCLQQESTWPCISMADKQWELLTHCPLWSSSDQLYWANCLPTVRLSPSLNLHSCDIVREH